MTPNVHRTCFVKFVGAFCLVSVSCVHGRPKKLLDSDLVFRPFTLRRQEEVQAYTYATKATKVFADCLVYVVVGALVHPGPV